MSLELREALFSEEEKSSAARHKKCHKREVSQAARGLKQGHLLQRTADRDQLTVTTWESPPRSRRSSGPSASSMGRLKSTGTGKGPPGL